MTVDIYPSVLSCLCPGMSQSLESVLSGHRPRSQTVTTVRVDQQGRLVPPALAAHSVVMQKDPRRFSEASIGPPPRPPPPKRQNMKSQRRPVVLPIPGTPWPPHTVMAPQPQQSTGGSNLGKMTHMARSTPQLDDNTDGRERERSREKPHHLQNTRDNLISQVKLQLFVFKKKFYICLDSVKQITKADSL